MVPVGKKARRLYVKMNHQFQLSFGAYVSRIIKLNLRRKLLIMKEAELVKACHVRDLRTLSETDFAVRSPGLYLSEQQHIDNLMKKYLKNNLEALKETRPRMKPIIFQKGRMK